MSTELQSRFSIPKWMLLLVIIGLLAALFGGRMLNVTSFGSSYQADIVSQKTEPLFEFRDVGQRLEVKGSNLLAPGTIRNTEELNEKVTKAPGNSYIQDTEDMSIISISVNKEELESVQARINEYIVGFKVEESAENVEILPKFSNIPTGTKRISLIASVYSNSVPAKDSFLAQGYVEDAVAYGKPYPATLSKDMWDNGKTVYIRIFLYKNKDKT